ncbi:MAG TPA: response regulator [Longimicrobiales bacterium]|nr:response regulator [Longimicrobiales bacterium]
MATVLFVDDQFELRAIHSAYLQRHGYEVVTASDGDTAIDLARSTRPDVIILDHTLPRRTGVEVARALHNDPMFAAIPIVMLTAHTYGAVGRKARDAGCSAFLSKPCTPGRLLEEVRRFTSPASA